MVDNITMRKFFLITISLFLALALGAQTVQNSDVSDEAKIKRLYQLPENLPKPDEAHILQNILAGCLYGLSKNDCNPRLKLCVFPSFTKMFTF